jgi:hypothetical protein
VQFCVVGQREIHDTSWVVGNDSVLNVSLLLQLSKHGKLEERVEIVSFVKYLLPRHHYLVVNVLMHTLLRFAVVVV